MQNMWFLLLFENRQHQYLLWYIQSSYQCMVLMFQFGIHRDRILYMLYFAANFIIQQLVCFKICRQTLKPKIFIYLYQYRYLLAINIFETFCRYSLSEGNSFLFNMTEYYNHTVTLYIIFMDFLMLLA